MKIFTAKTVTQNSLLHKKWGHWQSYWIFPVSGTYAPSLPPQSSPDHPTSWKRLAVLLWNIYIIHGCKVTLYGRFPLVENFVPHDPVATPCPRSLSGKDTDTTTCETDTAPVNLRQIMWFSFLLGWGFLTTEVDLIQGDTPDGKTLITVQSDILKRNITHNQIFMEEYCHIHRTSDCGTSDNLPDVLWNFLHTVLSSDSVGVWGENWSSRSLISQ